MSSGRVYVYSPEVTDDRILDDSMGNSPSNDERDQDGSYADHEKDVPTAADDAADAAAPPPRHTHILDLTYGAGGEDVMKDAASFYDDDDDGEEEEEDEEEDDDTDNMAPTRSKHSKKSSKSSSSKFNPETPGKVVDFGQEHTGRWTREEHEAFLDALRIHGKEWKKVAAKVKTRTVVQTRTHAQKYFQKLQKAMEQSGGKAVSDFDVEMGVAAEPKKSSTTTGSHGKRKRTAAAAATADLSTTSTTSSSASKALPVPLSLSKQPRSASMIGAAQLISSLSSAGTMQMQAPAPQPAAASGMLSLSSPPSIMTTISSSAPPLQPPPPPHGFTTAALTSSDSMQQLPFLSTASTTSTLTGWNANHHSTTGTTTSSGNTNNSSLGSLMKIVAPDHDSASKQGKFPEPSPAASGKRKLAEIAAARMLAGVAAASGSSSNNNNNTNMPPSTTMLYSSIDGDATPPPVPEMEDAMLAATTATASITKSEMPSLPLDTTIPHATLIHTNNTGIASRKGLSLQIVNPEALGVLQDDKRRRHGETSPQTPWDSQLEVLLSESRVRATTGGHDQTRKKPVGNGGLGLAAEIPPLNVCGPANAFGRTGIHQSVCELDLVSLEKQLSDDDTSNQLLLDQLDTAGYSPLHTACALPIVHPDQAPLIFDMVRMLLSAGANPSVTDKNENTALHWAARSGSRELAQVLLAKNCRPDTKNKQGDTSLHWALRAGRNGMDVVSVLLENGARPSVLNNDFKRPIDVAADGFLDQEGDPCHCMDDLMKRRKKLSKEHKKQFQDIISERCEVRKHLLILSTQSRTLVLHHPECLQHIPKSKTDWEVPDRVTSIMRRILPSNDATGATETSGIFPHEVTVSQEFEKAKIELLRRIHSTEYLAFVSELSRELERQHREATEATAPNMDCSNSTAGAPPPVVPFTPMVQRSMIKIEEPKVKLSAHSDTSFCAGSLLAARRAAGAVQHAVDCVLVGRNRNAFCVVRPPGHHAGTNGLLEGGESCGFCIFNSVAAGAMHAISDDLCERCAIVDIDVHHGNGTEEIVRKCQDPRKLFFFSIHLYDNDKRKRGSVSYKFYPGTGDEDDVAFNIINVPIAPLWREGVTIPGTPVNTHNTRQKARSKSARSSPSQEGDESSEPGTPLDKASDVESEAASMRGTSSSSASPRKTGPTLAGRVAYRDAIQNRLLPALRAFDPDLILISAGFDAAKGDVGNARHERGGKERMGIDLEPEDYAWTTRKILQVADICCQGRVVSVLEGGYGRTPPGERRDMEALPLDKTYFAECAIRHLQAMLDPYDAEARFST